MADAGSRQFPQQGGHEEGRDGTRPAGAAAMGDAGDARLEGREFRDSRDGNRGAESTWIN